MTPRFRTIRNYLHCPKEVPHCFRMAMEKTLARIIERERVELAWAEIWKARDSSKHQK